ncbi:hypothetical protein [Flectobacillus major]|uniref:hypothetical protein n=1 Tax=Flectobacillus major TaxID=103 RepID=UPI00047C0D22|nr:hypothetical protein [Flectobacillus major]
MSKNSVIENLQNCSSNDSSLYNTVILFLVKNLQKFRNEYDFEIEIGKKNVDISIENNGLFLFIYLDEDTLSLRYIQSEFYILINEIVLEELELLLSEFFKGKYEIISFTYQGLIVKQELNFTNPKIMKYNQIDIYGTKKRGL